MSCAINHVTLSGHTNRCKYVVSCTHDVSNIGIVEFTNNSGGGRFQLVFEYDKAKEIKVTLSILASQFSDLCPIQRFDMLGRAGDDSKASVSVEAEQILIIHRD